MCTFVWHIRVNGRVVQAAHVIDPDLACLKRTRHENVERDNTGSFSLCWSSWSKDFFFFFFLLLITIITFKGL